MKLTKKDKLAPKQPKTIALPCVDGYKYHSLVGPTLHCERCGKPWSEIQNAQQAQARGKVQAKAHRAGYSLPVVVGYFLECGLPVAVPEYRFDSERLFRFDFAWPAHKVALEVQGGIFARLPGGHNRGAQIRKEHEKFSLAACLGWRIIYCETETLCTQDTVNLIRRALDWQP